MKSMHSPALPNNRLKARIALAVSIAALALIPLAGCSTPAPATDSGGSTSEESSPPAEAPAAEAELTVASTSLGDVVVGKDGLTVYMFDKDTQGATASACTGDCAAAWPAVTTESDTPVVDGVTGELGTITGSDGAKQVTLNGWPLYYFAKDTAAGDVNGQGVGGIWWVLSPAGEKMAG